MGSRGVMATDVPKVVGLSLGPTHAFSKQPRDRVRLLAGLGVEGDAHCGATVRHRSRVAQDPTQPNLRQVHLIHAELFTELAAQGFAVAPGELGENVTTIGIDLLALPRDTRLVFPSGATLRVTGLRNPCAQIDRFREGLRAAVSPADDAGRVVRKAGVMAVVEVGGDTSIGDAIRVDLPAQPFVALERV